MLKKDSLVLYKNQAAVVTAVSKKVDIQTANGQRVSVRPKDVELLHEGPLKSLAHLRDVGGEDELEIAWELMAGESSSLADVAELAFDEITPVTIWAVWQAVVEGVYFSGSIEAVNVHTEEQVAEIRASRAAKAAEEAEWNAFLARIKAGEMAEGDGRFLQETIALANDQVQRSRVLQALKQNQSRENAHQLLLNIGYWDSHVNPYPLRFGLPINQPDMPLPDLPDEERRDLTHMVAYAIDDEGNKDPDDALSWENGRLWVHIADVGALIAPDSPADLEARARGANLYVPEGTITMLPEAATAQLGLGLSETSPALSFGLTVSDSGEIEDVEITPSWVRVTRLTYAGANERLDEPILSDLHRLAQIYRQRRVENEAVELDLPEVRIRVVEGEVVIRPLPKLASRDLVREAMLMTGEAIGRFGLQNNIPLPFTTQGDPHTRLDLSGGMAANFAQRKQMNRSQQTSAPGAHAGLGMGLYVQCTSPLRRYLDLVVHQQLRAWLRGEGMLAETAVMERVGAADAISRDVRQAERLSNHHWTLVYLQQNPEWKGEGVVVDRRGKQNVVVMPDIELETRIHNRGGVELNGRIRVTIKDVSLPQLDAHFGYQLKTGHWTKVKD
ncbi:MAG: RNB domain-containing ribonuclease [Chloroflexi bacterium]|nr:RNB domain-containing ribonuclease [Chloroflexota bacterium]